MLSKREGLMLYWCEGDKYTSKNKYKIAVTSTESRMVLLFVEWLNENYDVNRSKIKLRLHLWNTDIEQESKEFWSKELDIPIENFTKSWIKNTSGKNKKHKFGLCRASIDSKEIFLSIMSDIEIEFYNK